MSDTPTLRRSEVRAWLAGMEAKATTCKTGDCPLESYLRMRLVENPRVYCGAVYWGPWGSMLLHTISTPAWAAAYIVAIDLFTIDRSCEWDELTAAELLTILDALPEDASDE